MKAKERKNSRKLHRDSFGPVAEYKTNAHDETSQGREGTIQHLEAEPFHSLHRFLKHLSNNQFYCRYLIEHFRYSVGMPELSGIVVEIN